MAPPASFSEALFVCLLWVLENTDSNSEILLCSSTEYLTNIFVTERTFHETNMLNVNFNLLKAVFAALNERCGRIRFKKIAHNPAAVLKTQPAEAVLLDTEIDVIFNCPGVLILTGTRQYFTKVIKRLKGSPTANLRVLTLTVFAVTLKAHLAIHPLRNIYSRHSVPAISTASTTTSYESAYITFSVWAISGTTLRILKFWANVQRAMAMKA